MLRRQYPWVIAAMGVLTYVMVMGLCSPVLAIYLPFIEELDHISDSSGSTILTVRCLTSFLATFVVLKYYERVSLRAGVSLMMLFSALGIAVMGIGGRRVRPLRRKEDRLSVHPDFLSRLPAGVRPAR